MMEEFLYDLELGSILLGSLVIFLAATEIGFRLGRRAHSRVNADAKSELSILQGAIMGLLALLLGFTFSMAISRYEVRKQLVLEEANAIGTTYLRAQLLPEPERREVSNLLRKYVAARLEYVRVGLEGKKLDEAKREMDAMHKRLWSHAMAVGEQDPRSITRGLFIQSLNEVIDLYGKRLQALENHVPGIIIELLFFIAIIATGLIGYGCGVGGRRNFFVTLATSLLIAAVILVILDLDRPRRGLIKVSQQRLVELQDSLAGH